MIEFKGTTRTWYCDETTVKTVEIPIAYVGGENKEMSLANAKLISAAPDLLAFAIDFVEKVESGRAKSTDSYNKAQAAIAKALTI